MKKLLFAASAIIAGATFAEGIVSSSVVGYAGSDLSPWGATMVTPQFVDVAENGKVYLKDITPVGDDAAYTVEIQILNDDGTTNDELDYTWTGAKWTFTDGGADANTVQFTPGQGMWVYSLSEEPAKFQSAGQVGTAVVDIPLSPWGAVGAGNPYPVALTLGQITPVGDDVAYTVEIQILNDDGTTNDELDYTWTGSKWTFTDGGADANAVEITPGLGLWVYSLTEEDAVLRFPGITL
jgi:hypothetical protein